MFSVKKINTRYTQLCGDIFNRKIKDGLEVLQELVAETGFNDFFIQLEHLESTYEQMLKYTLEGIHDPERDKIFQGLQISIIELADRVKAALLKKYSGWHTYILQEELETQQKLTGKGVIETLDDLEFRTELDNIINEKKTTPHTSDVKRRELSMSVFKHLWLTDRYGEAEQGLVKALVSCTDFTWYELSQQVVAILLSALRNFNEEKVHKLIDFVDLEDKQVSGRALASLVILLNFYDKRLFLYPSIVRRLELLKDSTDLENILEQIVLQLTRTEDTLAIGKKLHEDIIPEMTKLKPKLEDKLKMEDLQEEDLLGEKNPDWQEVFKDSDDLYKKVDEFMKLQMEGADVYMTTFSRLKNFPFFNELSNWIVPFYEENPDLKEVYDQASEGFNPELFIAGLKKMPFLCNSDKYSFIFNVKYLPDEQKKMLSTAFQMEMESMSEMISDEELMDPRFERRLVFVQYIQDLYRFFKLSPFKYEFEDVFKGKLEVHKSFFFSSLVEDNRIVRNIAEYYFEKEHFKEALNIFKKELEMDPVNSELLEKAGFCYQQAGNYREAIHLYQQIGGRQASGSWVTKNLGICYRKLEDYQNALIVFQRAALENPDDVRTESLIGYCNMKLEHYDVALKHYFKIEYMNPKNTSVIRPIAWCYFALGEFEKSEKYYQKIFDLKTDYYDYVNFGHLKWAMGDRKDAIENYILSTAQKNFNFGELQKTIEEDTAELLRSGIDPEEIPLMMDYLRYKFR